VETVARMNPGKAELQAAAMRYMLLQGKLQFAVDCATRLTERHAAHPKTMISLLRLQSHWAKLSAEEKTTLLKTEEAIAAVDAAVSQFVKAAEKLESELKVKTVKTLSEWSELLNLQIHFGRQVD